jgi:hypothetical protein
MNKSAQVKIGKTVYTITKSRPYIMGGTVWALLKGKAEKTLVYEAESETFVLWSNNGGHPKIVTNVEFEFVVSGSATDRWAKYDDLADTIADLSAIENRMDAEKSKKQ